MIATNIGMADINKLKLLLNLLGSNEIFSTNGRYFLSIFDIQLNMLNYTMW